MIIETDDAARDWDAVVDLLAAVGWGGASAAEVEAAFSRSGFKAFAIDDGRLVGIGRTIDDGRFYASIVDVAVHPDWQRRGIGQAIVRNLQERLAGFKIITLTATPALHPFYRRLGWRTQTTAMMLPRSPEQAAANCREARDEDGE